MASHRWHVMRSRRGNRGGAADAPGVRRRLHFASGRDAARRPETAATGVVHCRAVTQYSNQHRPPPYPSMSYAGPSRSRGAARTDAPAAAARAAPPRSGRASGAVRRRVADDGDWQTLAIFGAGLALGIAVGAGAALLTRRAAGPRPAPCCGRAPAAPPRHVAPRTRRVGRPARRDPRCPAHAEAPLGAPARRARARRRARGRRRARVTSGCDEGRRHRTPPPPPRARRSAKLLQLLGRLRLVVAVVVLGRRAADHCVVLRARALAVAARGVHAREVEVVHEPVRLGRDRLLHVPLRVVPVGRVEHACRRGRSSP